MSRQFAPGFQIHDQRDAQWVDLLHGGAHDGAQAVEFLGGRFEEQFVVHLQDHAGAQLLRGEFAMDRDHGQLDESAAVPCRGVFSAVRSARLRRLNCGRSDFGNRTAAAETACA